MPLTQGQELNNRYRIVSLIGQGGFGAVYRAWDLTLKRPCAVKENLDASAEAQKQFDREVQLLANLHHSNLPRIYDYFFLPGMGQYLVMDFIEGQDLQTMLAARGQLPEIEVLPWVRQICDALEYMHSQTPPVVHRDIKPANIIITPQGRAVLVDFGISKVYDPHLKTTVGARAVTPGFSPWEQYGQGTTDNRSDLYALGATLYTLLTGQEPPESVALLGGMAILTPPRQLNPALAPHVAQTIEKALQSRPTDRHPSAAALAQALLPPTPLAQPSTLPVTPAPSPQPTTGKTWLWGVGGVVVLLLMGLVFVIGRGGFQPVLVEIEVTRVVSVAPTAEPPNQPTSTRIAPTDGMVQVYVPAGEFTMGSETGQEDEKPVHTVYLDDYWLDQTEVTNAQFDQFVAATGYETTAEQEGGGHTWTTSGWNYTEGANWQRPQGPGSSLSGLDDHPVVLVSWHDAAAYCEWAGRRLPTEAEWEKGARGTGARVYPWGNQFDCSQGNFDDETVIDEYVVPGGAGCDGYDLTSPVGSFPTGASPYGALDMAGNVWEWVADWYDAGYYDRSPARNPTGPTSGDYTVLRGGSWNFNDNNVRAANRYNNDPSNRSSDVGFRCAQE